MLTNLRIGTSGFSYREWLGAFYPARLPGKEMLAYYAARMPTVEINYTFRAMPKPAMFEGWAGAAPPAFRFALKAPERITHRARLVGTDEAIDRFDIVARVLGERLGPVLFQLPPDFKIDLGCLRDFLTLLNGRLRPAFEFRNRSWFSDTTFQTLRDFGAALCIAESEKLATPIEQTAAFVYVRLRKPAYDDAALAVWAARIAELASAGNEVYVYLKHELRAPELAETLSRLVAERGGRR
jgi:uncharacterized protein YecE (DUF72 family)